MAHVTPSCPQRTNGKIPLARRAEPNKHVLRARISHLSVQLPPLRSDNGMQLRDRGAPCPGRCVSGRHIRVHTAHKTDPVNAYAYAGLPVRRCYGVLRINDIADDAVLRIYCVCCASRRVQFCSVVFWEFVVRDLQSSAVQARALIAAVIGFLALL